MQNMVYQRYINQCSSITYLHHITFDVCDLYRIDWIGPLKCQKHFRLKPAINQCGGVMYCIDPQPQIIVTVPIRQQM